MNFVKIMSLILIIVMSYYVQRMPIMLTFVVLIGELQDNFGLLNIMLIIHSVWNGDAQFEFTIYKAKES